MDAANVEREVRAEEEKVWPEWRSENVVLLVLRSYYCAVVLARYLCGMYVHESQTDK